MPGLWEARGRCGGPFPLDGRGKPLLREGKVRDGVVTVSGEFVLPDPRFKSVEWDRCPVAAVGHRECPAPEAAESWLVDAFNTANWTVDGRPLRDFVEHPTDALKDAVLLIQSEAAKMHERIRKSGG